LSLWEWLASRRQKEVLKHYESHIREVENVVEKSHNLLEDFARGNFDEMRKKWSEIFDSERKADEIKRRLLRELMSELVHPIDREELIRLIMATDDIATFAKEWSRMALLYDEAPPKEIIAIFLEMSSSVRAAVQLIKDAIAALGTSREKALEVCDRIERLEEEVDDLRHRGLSLLLPACDQLKPHQCLLLKDILEYIEMSADKTEDVADELRSIAVFSS